MGNKSELSRNPEAQPVQINIPSQSPGDKKTIISPVIMPDDTIESTAEGKSQSLDSFISDINASEKLKDILTGTDLEGFCDADLPISDTLSQTAERLQSINIIKDELYKLPLDTSEMQFIINNINPLLNILYQLSTTSYNLSGSTNLLSISSIVKPKRSELKDTVHLVYKINDECEDVYEVLKKRINSILKNKE